MKQTQTIDEIAEREIKKKRISPLKRLALVGLTSLVAGCCLIYDQDPVGSFTVDGDYLRIEAHDTCGLSQIEVAVDKNHDDLFAADETETTATDALSFTSSVYIPSLGLTPGAYDARLRIIDSSGNQVDYTQSFTVLDIPLTEDTTPPESTSLTVERNDLVNGGMRISFPMPADGTVPGEARSPTVGAKIFISPYNNMTIDELVTGTDQLNPDDSIPADYVQYLGSIAPESPNTSNVIDHAATLDGFYGSWDTDWTVYLVLTDGAYDAATDSFADGNERLVSATVTTGGPDENRHNLYGSIGDLLGSYAQLVEFRNPRDQIIATTDYVDGQFWQYLENLPDGMEITITNKATSGSLTISYTPKGINDGTEETIINGLDVPMY